MLKVNATLLVRNNKATTGSGALSISNVTGATKNVIIENCLIINNESGTSPQALSIAVANTEIRNTTIANNLSNTAGTTAAITGSVAYKVYNSIICNNYNVTTLAKSFGVGTAKALTNNAWDAAATDGTLTSNILLTSSPFVAATGFQGAANGVDKLASAIESADFKLVSGSPCINAGNNTYATATKDLGNIDRIVQTTVDLGCYESSFTTAQGFNYLKVNGLKVVGNKIQLPETAIGQTVRIFNVNGMLLKNFVAGTNEIAVAGNGIYFVNINNDIYKVKL